MRRWRAFHESFPQHCGAIVRLGSQESHHIARVLRLNCGDRIELFDGKSAAWQAIVGEIGQAGVAVQLERQIETTVESTLDLRLFQGLCRADKMDGIVQKLTEVGAVAIHPFNCRNAERFPPQPIRLKRWRRIAIEACKQSGRHRVPAVEAVEVLPEPETGTLALLLAPEAVPIGDSLKAAVSGEVWIAVGPKSGLQPDEVAAAEAAGWLPVSLGPRILRTEGAGFAAACIVLHRLADLGR